VWHIVALHVGQRGQQEEARGLLFRDLKRLECGVYDFAGLSIEAEPLYLSLEDHFASTQASIIV
jgi:hypothetical protein